MILKGSQNEFRNFIWFSCKCPSYYININNNYTQYRKEKFLKFLNLKYLFKRKEILYEAKTFY